MVGMLDEECGERNNSQPVGHLTRPSTTRSEADRSEEVGDSSHTWRVGPDNRCLGGPIARRSPRPSSPRSKKKLAACQGTGAFTCIHGRRGHPRKREGGTMSRAGGRWVASARARHRFSASDTDPSWIAFRLAITGISGRSTSAIDQSMMLALSAV